MTLRVDEVMTRDVATLGPDLSLTEMDRILLAADVSGAPVVEDERLVGVISRADVVRMLYEEQKRAQKVSDFYTSPFPIPIPALEHLARDSREIADRMTKTRVRELMSTKPRCVRPDESLETAARLMWEEGFHRLPVVSDGHLEGILSSMDVVRLVAEHGLATA
jgi:CBS domain-containing protein